MGKVTVQPLSLLSAAFHFFLNRASSFRRASAALSRCLRGSGAFPQLEIVAKITAIFYRDLFSLGLFTLVGGSLTVTLNS